MRSTVTRRLTAASAVLLLLAFGLVADTALNNRPRPAPINAFPRPATPPPLRVGEQADRRTGTSVTRFNADHTFTTTVYAAPVNYLDSHGRWQPIDSTLGPSTAKGYAYQNRANAFTVRFKDTLGPDHLQLVTGGAAVGVSLAGATRAAATVRGSSVEYPGALPHVNLRYDVGAEAVEETLVLADRVAPATYQFELSTPGGTTVTQLPDGDWAFHLPGSPGQSFALTPPVVYDSSKSLEPGGTHGRLDVAPQAGGFRVDVSVDRAWLSDPARQFPVFVDPTVSIQPD